MFKKVLALTLAVLMCATMAVAFSSCKKDDDFKVGFIFLHDENSTYDKNFIDAAKAACEAAGVEYVFKKNITESQECYNAAKDLIADGCTLIFADSFGHEDYLIQAAKENPEVQFCHATGTKAHTEGLSNFHNAFASIYEGRYLAGIAAGLKLKEMIDNGTIPAGETPLMGYVGAFTYAEVMSGYTSFYLGAKSVCPTVTMKVTFTGAWYDEAKEKAAAEKLISVGCHLISQHADSMGAPNACETAGIPNVSYNGSTQTACPNTFIVSSRINWEPYYTYIIEQTKKDEAIDADWTGTLSNGAVVLTDVNTNVAAAGTVEAIATAKAAMQAGTLKVFDLSKDNFITVGGNKVTTYLADVNTDADFTKDTEVVKTENGVTYFSESTFRSAPYFDMEIDGIELLDRNYGD